MTEDKRRRSVAPKVNDLDAACRDVMSNVDGALACAMVDLENGLLIGFHAADRSKPLEEALTQATIDLLCRRSAGAPSQGLSVIALEAHVMSERSYHFAKVLDGGKAAIMLVTNRSTNAALGSAQLKAAIPKISPKVR